MLRLTLLAVFAASPQDPTTSAATTDLATLRVEVDELATSLRHTRDDTFARLQALRAERSDLQRQVRLARIRHQTLARIARDAASEVADVEADIQRWALPVRAAVNLTREYVSDSLPFARVQRLERLDHIEAELEGHHPDAARAMELLWRFIEEEAAMTGEVTMAQQAVDINGETRLTYVLRIGMTLLYVRSHDGRFAWAARRDGQWNFEWLDEAAAVALVSALFESHEANETFGPTELLVPRVAEDPHAG